MFYVEAKIKRIAVNRLAPCFNTEIVRVAPFSVQMEPESRKSDNTSVKFGASEEQIGRQNPKTLKRACPES